MKSALVRLFPKNELEGLFLLHALHFWPMLVAEIALVFAHGGMPWGLPIFLSLYVLSRKTLKSLYYSFWTFAGLLWAFYLISALRFWMIAPNGPLFWFPLLSLCLLSAQMYKLYGPIYYPVVNWWEYDFRFRSDVKILVRLPDHAMVEARLTDLRRQAGCVVLFDELSIGDVVTLRPLGELQGGAPLEMTAQVMSKRLPLPGRGNHYGVRFHFTGKDDRTAMRELVSYWNKGRRLKLKMKAPEMKDHVWNMNLALEEAEAAYKIGEVPIGAVLVDGAGKVVSKAHNLKETVHDPCGHAEILALREAAAKAKTWRLTGHTLYVSLEPCAMCMGAMVHARIGKLVFGAYDPKAGALSLGYALHKDQRLNHRFAVLGGVRHLECSRVLSTFFRERRSGFGPKPAT